MRHGFNDSSDLWITSFSFLIMALFFLLFFCAEIETMVTFAEHINYRDVRLILPTFGLGAASLFVALLIFKFLKRK